MKQLKRISVEDNYIFTGGNARDDVMEACFAPHKIGLMKASARTYDGGFAWFPKEEIIDKTGQIKSGAQSSNWKNHFEDSGRKIISWLYEDEPETEMGTLPSLMKDIRPVHCFWGEIIDGMRTYKYVGTYLYDYNSSLPRHRVYRRIGTEIDLTPWYSGNGDFEYYDFVKEGVPAFKHIYLNNNYAFHKKTIKEFLRASNTSWAERKLDEIIKETNDLPIRKVEEFVDSLISSYNKLFGKKIDKKFFYRDGATNEIVGRFIVDIKQLKENQHNEFLHDNYLGDDAGKILALFDKQYFLYSLSEEETEFYLSKLKLHYNKNDDLTEKHNLLYFWKQCISEMEEWSSYKFYEFLRHIFGAKNDDKLEDNYRGNTSISGFEKPVYLLAWNPDVWSWDQSYSEMVENVSKDNPLTEPWTVKNSSIHRGDIVYLMRLGVEPKGIIAMGHASSEVYLMDHYNKERASKGERTKHVDARFELMLDYENGKYIPLEKLKALFPNQQWTPPSSGIAIRSEYWASLNKLWSEYTSEENRERFYKTLQLPHGFEAKRYTGMNRVHFKYNSVGFAVIDMNVNSYNLATRKEFLAALGINDYEYTDNLGPNHAIIRSISYNDSRVLYKLFDYISSDDNQYRIYHNNSFQITYEEITASEEFENRIRGVVESKIQIKDKNDEYTYIPKPEDRKTVNDKDGYYAAPVYPRDPQKKVNALKRARFRCEINPEHESFISRKTEMPYMETHHLIPLEYWRYFVNSLDVEANIVCLCSNCHNEIHYGKYANKLIEPLFIKRESELLRAGIDIELGDLIRMYNGETIQKE
ncbi:HNH endonuclease [Eubacterium ruminantium]|nr:HNH endonuclease [Eubacterium ruminantium]